MVLLWAHLLDVFGGDEGAALAAALKNTAIIFPYLNRPTNIAGSWAVLQEMLGSREEALEVVTKNPASSPATRTGSRRPTRRRCKPWPPWWIRWRP